MLKIRVIPILTFNGFGLVKTLQFSNPRMIGNPVQAAKIFNSRGVDELIFLDITASKQKRKINLSVAKEIIKECFMPIGIGGGIDSLEDINNLLKIGADKVVLKSVAFDNENFIKESSNYFGTQCISIAVDVKKINGEYRVYNYGTNEILASDFIYRMQEKGAGEIILTSVDNEGLMNGFDLELFNEIEKNCDLPIVFVGGAGDLNHFDKLFSSTNCYAVGASSIFHFTQYTPLDIKNTISKLNKPVRI